MNDSEETSPNPDQQQNPKPDKKHEKEPHEQQKEPQLEEWEVQRNHHKSLADSAFKASNFPIAISNYTLALSFDPSHHILLSNRSAAYLSNGEKSRALADARRCVELQPDFVKGHSRVASAMASLGRWNEARKVYGHILENLDSENSVAKRGVEDCRVREQRMKEEREKELARLLREEKRREEEEAKNVRDADDADTKEKVTANDQEGGAKKVEKEDEDEDDLLNDFFDDVETVTAKKAPKPEPIEPPDGEATTNTTDPENKIQIQLSDLGTAKTQIDRLLCSNHEWYNLNPYRVLDISHRAPKELISRRYKALSLLLHPDKVRNTFGGCSDEDRETAVDRAAIAFEFVRKAMEILNDEDKAHHISALIDEGCRIGKKDYEKACSAQSSNSSTSMNETQKEELKKLQDKATLKIFAEIEHKRRDVERRKRSQEMRERAQEDAEVKKSKDERCFDKNWKEKERVEKRIGNWRDFQRSGRDEKKKKIS